MISVRDRIVIIPLFPLGERKKKKKRPTEAFNSGHIFYVNGGPGAVTGNGRYSIQLRRFS